MNDWKFCFSRRIAGASINTNKSGILPLEAEKELVFRHETTGVIFKTTDIEYRKSRRNKFLGLFLQCYLEAWLRKYVSIFLISVRQDQYPRITTFIDFFEYLLKKAGLEMYGYFWVRDVGDTNFERHYHLVIVTRYITGDALRSILRKDHGKYDAIMCEYPRDFINYLQDKELYAQKGERTFGRSRKFKMPFGNLLISTANDSIRLPDLDINTIMKTIFSKRRRKRFIKSPPQTRIGAG